MMMADTGKGASLREGGAKRGQIARGKANEGRWSTFECADVCPKNG